VEPGFFRTDLLDPYNVRYAPSTIADYADEGSAEDIVSGYHGQQQGDPAKLGNVLVKLAGRTTDGAPGLQRGVQVNRRLLLRSDIAPGPFHWSKPY
jgi:hypothetical protein